jgi:hypothetical protein
MGKLLRALRLIPQFRETVSDGNHASFAGVTKPFCSPLGLGRGRKIAVNSWTPGLLGEVEGWRDGLGAA